MKLLRYTHFNLSFLLFLLLGGWGTFFYYTVIDEVMDETDDAWPITGILLWGKSWRTLPF